jgi:hypothetical protein
MIHNSFYESLFRGHFRAFRMSLCELFGVKPCALFGTTDPPKNSLARVAEIRLRVGPSVPGSLAAALSSFIPSSLHRCHKSRPSPPRAAFPRNAHLPRGEFTLGIEAWFVACEPMRRVHKCVFGILDLEREPVRSVVVMIKTRLALQRDEIARKKRKVLTLSR